MPSWHSFAGRNLERRFGMKARKIRLFLGSGILVVGITAFPACRRPGDDRRPAVCRIRIQSKERRG